MANGSTDWITFKDLKESHPVELANDAKEQKIDDEPAFAWGWVLHVMQKQKRILEEVLKVKSMYWARNHKYGIQIPKNVKEAIDE